LGAAATCPEDRAGGSSVPKVGLLKGTLGGAALPAYVRLLHTHSKHVHTHLKPEPRHVNICRKSLH